MSATTTIPNPAAVPDAKKLSSTDQFFSPVDALIDDTFPDASLKKRSWELKSGKKFPISFSPLNDFFHSIPILFWSEKATSSLGSSGSISSLFQNLKPSIEEQELKRAIEHSIDRFVFLKVSIL